MKNITIVAVGFVLSWVPFSEALLVVGDSGGSSIYTEGAGAGSGWDYTGSLVATLPIPDHGPSSASYVSNGWFVTANHVWTGDVIGRGQESVLLGGEEYSINLGSYTHIDGADLAMFRVNEMAGLPAGMAVLEETPHWADSLRLIGNGYDNDSTVGMTWGNGTPLKSGGSTYTQLVGSTESYFSVYDSGAEGDAYGQTYDSGGGVFVDGQLAGIMINVGSVGDEEVTVVTDFSVYGGSINSIAAIPEPSVLVLAIVFPAIALGIRRFFLI